MRPVKKHCKLEKENERDKEGERDRVRVEAENQTAILRGRDKSKGRGEFTYIVDFAVFVCRGTAIHSRCKQQTSSASLCTHASGGIDSASSFEHEDEQHSYRLPRAMGRGTNMRGGREVKQSGNDVPGGEEGRVWRSEERGVAGSGWRNMTRRILAGQQEKGRRGRVAQRLRLLEIHTNCTSSCDTEEIEDEDMYDRHGFQHRTAFSCRKGTRARQVWREGAGEEDSKSQEAAWWIGVEEAGPGAEYLVPEGRAVMGGKAGRCEDGHYAKAQERPGHGPKSRREVTYINDCALARARLCIYIDLYHDHTRVLISEAACMDLFICIIGSRDHSALA